MADDQYGFAMQLRKATDDSFIIMHLAITMQLHEMGEDLLDIEEGVRTFGMPGKLDFLPSIEVAVNLFFQVDNFLLEVLDSSGDIDVPLGFNGFDLLELIVETFERLLKLKVYHKLLINRP